MNLTFIHGDTEEIELIVTDKSDVVQDITGWSFWFTLKKDNANEDDAAVLQKTVSHGIEIVDAEAGKILITIEPGDRSAVVAGRVYKWDVQCKDADDRIKTLAGGAIEIAPDTTHATS